MIFLLEKMVALSYSCFCSFYRRRRVIVRIVSRMTRYEVLLLATTTQMTAKYRHTCKVRAESAVFPGKYWAVWLTNKVLPQQWGRCWLRLSTQARFLTPSPSWNKIEWPLHSPVSLHSSFFATFVGNEILVRVLGAGLELIIVLDLCSRDSEHYKKILSKWTHR